MTHESNARRALVAAGEGDLKNLRRIYEEDPESIYQVADNPYWGGRVQPLHLAVIWKQDAIVEFLLDAGADPSGENSEYGGWSPLMLAARGGSSGIVERLRAAGATIGPFEAAALGDLDALRANLETVDDGASQTTIDDTTLLHLAGSVKVAKWLLDAGVHPEALDAYNRRPLDTALQSAAARVDGARALVDLLIEAGVPVDAATFAALGDLERLVPLIEADLACIDRIGSAGAPPLHAAVTHGRLGTVRWLLQNGADANRADSKGAYPLHLTANSTDRAMEIANELLAHGADPRARDGAEDALPASWAEFQRRPDLAKLLRRALG